MAISTLALTGGGGSAPAPAPKPPDKSALKEWVKKHLQALRRALAYLAGKAAADLPGIIGSIVSWLLSTLGKTATWLAEKFVGLGHCCGDPASRGCSRLASETITKAPQGRTLSQRPHGPFSSWAVALCRFSAGVPSCPSGLVLFCEGCGPF